MNFVKSIKSDALEEPISEAGGVIRKESVAPGLGPVAMKWLKILHLFLVALFFGGILSSLALTLRLNLSSFDEVYSAYNSIMIISDHIVEYGAQGTLILGVVYGVLTTWGFFKHKWLTVKWVVFIAQTFAGILVVDKLMVANMTLLETERSAALSNPIFLQNHFLRQAVVIAQIQ
jgi:hypothetical protein